MISFLMGAPALMAAAYGARLRHVVSSQEFRWDLTAVVGVRGGAYSGCI